MSNTNTKKLRREVEILKAQLAGKEPAVAPEKNRKEPGEKKKEDTKKHTKEAEIATYSNKHVQQDLKRSLLVTTGILTLITALYFSQPYWITLISF